MDHDEALEEGSQGDGLPVCGEDVEQVCEGGEVSGHGDDLDPAPLVSEVTGDGEDEEGGYGPGGADVPDVLGLAP